jgi:hypothetical protein
VNLAGLLESEPRRFSLPLAAALGMALGFYPGSPFFLPALFFAAAFASLGLVLQGSRASRLRSMQAFALAAGLAAGASVAWEEAGRAAPEAGGARLSPAWAEGRLSTDSSPAKNGFRSYSLNVERMGLAGPGVSAELSYPGAGRGIELRVLARAGPEIDSGALLRIHGVFAAAVAGGNGALFAQPKDIMAIDRGSAISRARSSVRDACRSAIARIGTRSSGLMQALILGVRDSLAPEEAEAFKLAGCSHILALSGEHLSVPGLARDRGATAPPRTDTRKDWRSRCGEPFHVDRRSGAIPRSRRTHGLDRRHRSRPR